MLVYCNKNGTVGELTARWQHPMAAFCFDGVASREKSLRRRLHQGSLHLAWEVAKQILVTSCGGTECVEFSGPLFPSRPFLVLLWDTAPQLSQV